MQITLNRVGENTITGTVDGQAFGISYSKERWDAMDELRKAANNATSMDELKTILEQFKPLTHESYKEVIESKSPYLYVNGATNRFYLKYNGEKSTEPLPQEFVDRILESTEKNVDPRPVVKCWARFLRNPNYTAEKAQLFAQYINQKYTDFNMVDKFRKEGITDENAIAMSTTFQTPITDEGLICTYKVSKEITKKFTKDDTVEGGVKEQLRDGHDYEVDEFSGLKTYKTPEFVEDRVFEPAVMGQGKDPFSLFLLNGTLYSTGHIIKVGYIHALDSWDKVDCRDNISCKPGLHCGNLDYIRSYQTEGTVTHYVLVDPMHVGAVVQDNTGALRVKQYMVYKSFVGANKNLYHSAPYGKLTDKEYETLIQEVVAKTRDEKISAAQAEFNNKSLLVGDGGLDS